MKKLSIILLGLLFSFCIKKEQKEEPGFIPDGAIWLEETIRRETPIPGYFALAIWAQAATIQPDQPETVTANIIVNYWKVIEIYNGDSTVIYTEDYDYEDVKTFNTNEAGFYCRYPKWFDTGCNDEHKQATNMSASNGFLVISMSKKSDVVLHWWTPKLPYKAGAIYCVESKLSIYGETAVQFGMDYWRTLNSGFNRFDESCETSNNCEAWISDWVGETNGEFELVTVPKRKK